MLQILIWAVCVLLIGVGFCASSLERIAAGNEKKSSTGVAVFVIMIIAAAFLFFLSLKQGEGILNLLN
jgi:hypothetical protein